MKSFFCTITAPHKQLLLRIAAAALLVACVSSLSAHVVIFGPASFPSEAGKPMTRTETFSLAGACQSNAVYTLTVVNGVEGRRVSSGQIALNGAVVISERDWNQGASELRTDVHLLSANSLSVTLKGGATDANVSISVVRHIDVTQPVLRESAFTKTATQSAFETSFSTTNLSDRFMLVVLNGDEQQSNRAASAAVSLNGVTVVGRGELTPQSVAVSHDVQLQTGNRLRVEIDGAVGATVRVLVVRHLSDEVGPGLTLNLPPAGAVAENSFTLTGRVVDPSGVATVTVGGVVVDTGADGAFAKQLTLQRGSNQVTVVAADCEGNQSREIAEIALDAAPPQLSITAPAAGAAVRTSSVTVSGTVTDDVRVASVSVNGVPATISGASFTATATFVPSANAEVSGTRRITVVATDWVGHQTVDAIDITVDTVPPAIVALADRDISVDGWYQAPLKLNFVCVDTTSGIATCSPSVAFSADGSNQSATGTAVDKAGNQQAVTTTVNVDGTAPVLQVEPPTSLVTRQAVLNLTGSASDATSGIGTVNCGSRAAMIFGTRFQCAVNLRPGVNAIEVEAVDRASNARRSELSVTLDTDPPIVSIAAPSDGMITNGSTAVVSGTVSDNLMVERVTVMGSAVAMTNGTFQTRVSLAEGVNQVSVTATDSAGNAATSVITINRYSVPAIAITSPGDYLTVRDASVVVTGTVSDPTAIVRVNGVLANIAGQSFTATVPIAQGRTVLTAVATNGAGHVSSADVMVYRDSIPPRVAIYTPDGDATVFQSPLLVTGMVDDIVVGTVNSGQVAVTVNGVAARVSNRSFVASVPLILGENTLTVLATDQSGNQSTTTQKVTYVGTGGSRHLEVVAGNGQSATVGTALPQPLIVRVVDAVGAALANQRVTFNVIENDGFVTLATHSGRSVAVVSDSAGQASVSWTLGSYAGAGNQRVQARDEASGRSVLFAATGTVGSAYHVAVDLGNHQFGAVSAALPQPLVAIVFDAASNRVPGIAVTFSTISGGGSLDGQQTRTVVTDSDGRATVRAFLGPDAGQDNNVFVASVAGAQFDATFRASGRLVGNPAETRISGVVLDNASVPVAGVSIRLDGTPLVTQTDAQGQFALSAVPVGYVKLFVDGSTAQRPGTWPMLEFPMYTIAGQENVIGMPVYLLPVDVTRGLQVDERKGGTLTFPELPGFSLSIAPGSATFPGGGRAGTVSVTLVHADKMPMPPSAGQQPRFIVTIQPPGTHFDPPAPISFPNLDALAAGQIVELSSFDHDLGQFVSIGTGAVSEDGSTINSELGVGIIKGGWHGVSLPPTTGRVVRCNECSTVVARLCVPNLLRTGHACRDDGNPCTEDICESGSCVHKPIEVVIGDGTSITGNVYVDRDDASRDWPLYAPLAFGQPLYANPILGDHVRWRASVQNESMRTRVTNYRWFATGAAPMSGPAGPTAAEWRIDSINWKAGTYLIQCEVTFDTGCRITAKYGQEIGIRTNEYFAVGAIRPGPPPSTVGVTDRTIQTFECDAQTAPMFLYALATGPNGGFNGDDSVTNIAYVPRDVPNRNYASKRVFALIADDEPAPAIDISRGPINAYGLSSDHHYRLFGRAQFKYRVRDGRLLENPIAVGTNVALTGETTSPCGTALIGPNLDGVTHPTSGKVFGGAGDTEFYFMVKVRAHTSDQLGYRYLLGRELPWVFIKLRFSAADGELHTHFELGPSDTHSIDGYPEVDDGKDYSFAPTFLVFRRDGDHATLLRRMDADFEEFTRVSPVSVPPMPFTYP